MIILFSSLSRACGFVEKLPVPPVYVGKALSACICFPEAPFAGVTWLGRSRGCCAAQLRNVGKRPFFPFRRYAAG